MAFNALLRVVSLGGLLYTITMPLCLCLVFSDIVRAATSRRPNIVFLMTDDQCTYSLGCYQTPHVKTPNIDQLAKEGVTFDRYYATTAICMASRATVMTGLLEYRTGCNFEHGPLLKQHWQNSYPVLLRKAGYCVGFAGKFGFEVAEHPDEIGKLPEGDFDRWGGGPGQTFYETALNPSIAEYAAQYPHSTLAYAAFARDFIRDFANQEKPFCLSISFKAPHRPETPDPRFDEVYADATFKKPGNFGREHGEHFAPQSRLGRQFERFVEWHYDDDYDNVMATYYQQVYGVDVALGMIRDALAMAGVAEKTVIIFTSDNGFLCGSHGYASKVLPYEEASRVPLIVFDPRNKKGQTGVRSTSLCASVDIAPTILDLAGLPSHVSLDGQSVLPLLESPTSSIHESIPLINVWGTPGVHSLAVVTKDWKYIYWPHDKSGYTPHEELYNTALDPQELIELSTDEKARQTFLRMRALYDHQVEAWKASAVEYHRYQEYGVTFDRRLAREEKEKMLKDLVSAKQESRLSPKNRKESRTRTTQLVSPATFETNGTP